jgi:hypothetical protein
LSSIAGRERAPHSLGQQIKDQKGVVGIEHAHAIADDPLSVVIGGAAVLSLRSTRPCPPSPWRSARCLAAAVSLPVFGREGETRRCRRDGLPAWRATLAAAEGDRALAVLVALQPARQKRRTSCRPGEAKLQNMGPNSHPARLRRAVMLEVAGNIAADRNAWSLALAIMATTRRIRQRLLHRPDVSALEAGVEADAAGRDDATLLTIQGSHASNRAAIARCGHPGRQSTPLRCRTAIAGFSVESLKDVFGIFGRSSLGY